MMKKLRRSMLFLPGSSAAMLSTAFIYKPDSIMFDLEDAVSLKEKDSARLLVFHALQHPMYKDIETVVRINPLNTPFGLKDLEAAVRAGVDVIRLPKTDTPEDIYQLEREIVRIEESCGRPVGSTQLMAAIESAVGVINAVAIARASQRLMELRWRRLITSWICKRNAATVRSCFTRAARYYMRPVGQALMRLTWSMPILMTKPAFERSGFD
ncbi:citrate lyase subunit beta [Klebsiella grimontii]|nr:citrate lyase subunit beta [Klebsiella grimontii]